MAIARRVLGCLPGLRAPTYVYPALQRLRSLGLPVELKPTRGKGSFYLLIPKDIAKLLDLNEKTSLTLRVINDEKTWALEYKVKNNNR